jgi:hypothetical protein
MQRPYDFFQSFVDAHLKAKIEPSPVVEHWLSTGYMFSTPQALMIGGNDPDNPKDPDTWFVYWAEVHPDLKGDKLAALRFFLDWMPYHRKNIKFSRGVDGKLDSKIYSTDRMQKLIGSRHIRP